VESPSPSGVDATATAAAAADTSTVTKHVQICLDRTVLHAQGGGQPTDTGRILWMAPCEPGGDDDSTNGGAGEEVAAVCEIAVTKVTLDRETGVATHFGTFEAKSSPSLLLSLSSFLTAPATKDSIGDDSSTVVRVVVDRERRRLLSECHSAGHVVDSAVARCGMRHLKPIKGYHFIAGPYVEYRGTIDASDRPSAVLKLQRAFEELVQEDGSTRIELLSKDDADAACNRQAQNFDMNVFADKRTQVRGKLYAERKGEGGFNSSLLFY